MRALASWDGATWHALARGFDDTVNGFVLLPNGDLTAFGSFNVAEGTTALRLARWTGQAWLAMNQPGTWLPFTIPTCGAVDVTGTLWVAGSTPGYGGTYNGNLVRWTGNGWQVFGAALGRVHSLVVPPNLQPTVGGAGGIVRWNGTTWLGMGAGLDGAVHSLLLRRNGDLAGPTCARPKPS